MSPTPREIDPGSGKEVIRYQLARMIDKAMKRYVESSPAEEIQKWELSGIAVEPGDTELIHPLITCYAPFGGGVHISLRPLGGYSETPFLGRKGIESQQPQGSDLTFWWGRAVGNKTYKYNHVVFPGLPGYYYCLMNKNYLSQGSYAGTEERLKLILLGATIEDYRRLQIGVEHAMGIRVSTGNKS